MNKAPTPRKYGAHRERQRRRILEAAGKLFDERGIGRVTMADIISATGIRASTMYQYFSNKDDVVWAILENVLAETAARSKEAAGGANTALARITGLLEVMADALTKDRAKVRFLAEFDAMYARHWPAERLLTLERQLSPRGFQHLGALIREGIADGSLRPDLDPDLTMQAIMNAVVGAQRRLAALGDKVELEYGQPVDRMFRETIRIILLGLRAAEEPAARGGVRRRKVIPKTKRSS